MTVVLITGGSSGIGLATVRRLAGAGDQVFYASRKPAAVPLAAEVTHVPLDLADPRACDAAVQSVVAAAGRLDVLINNAGTAVLAPLEEGGDAEAHQTFEVNVFGPMRLIRAALPVMRAQGGGRIINVTSVNDIAPGAVRRLVLRVEGGPGQPEHGARGRTAGIGHLRHRGRPRAVRDRDVGAASVRPGGRRLPLRRRVREAAGRERPRAGDGRGPRRGGARDSRVHRRRSAARPHRGRRGRHRHGRDVPEGQRRGPGDHAPRLRRQPDPAKHAVTSRSPPCQVRDWAGKSEPKRALGPHERGVIHERAVILGA